MGESPVEITRLLVAWSGGDEKALDKLMPLVYGRLRRLAASYLRRERPDHTLQTSALVNEAYLRLIAQDQVTWRDRAHFFALAAQMMRRILVDHARRHSYAKRGGPARNLSPVELDRVTIEKDPDVVAVDEALNALAEKDPQQAKLVELRYFGGLTKEEIAEVLGISSATVTRRWRLAKAWLFRYLVKGERDEL
jgi:RNA polymerase sigma factor (TIGR02999 family)